MTHFNVGRAFVTLDEGRTPDGHRASASAWITLPRDRTRYRSAIMVETTRSRPRDAKRERVRQLRELQAAINATLEHLECQ